MSLMDTIDGSFMNFAYGWAFSKPVRKVFYNLTITGLSVAVALVIGTIELGGLVADAPEPAGAFWDWFEDIDLNVLGFVIVGAVRRHLGDGAGGLALRPHRGALDRAPRARAGCGVADDARPRRPPARGRRPRRSDWRAARVRAADLDGAPADDRGAVRRDGPVSAQELAHTLSLEESSVYRNLEVLERHG